MCREDHFIQHCIARGGYTGPAQPGLVECVDCINIFLIHSRVAESR